jgi:hypothetical protein
MPKAITKRGIRKAANPKRIINQPETYAPIVPPRFCIASGGSVDLKKGTGSVIECEIRLRER